MRMRQSDACAWSMNHEPLGPPVHSSLARFPGRTRPPGKCARESDVPCGTENDLKTEARSLDSHLHQK